MQTKKHHAGTHPNARPRWQQSAVFAALTILLASTVLPSGTAIHPQNTMQGNATVQFDHDGDNEWWVEVLTKTSTGDSVVAMEVRAESSATFRGLQNKGNADGWTKWGPETAFRIPSGDRVMFRAHVHDGPTGNVATVDSCFFTHPAGVEQCASAPQPPPPADGWRTTVVGEAGPASFGGDMAIGDADNDGRRDVTMGTSAGIYTFEQEGGSWVRTRVGSSASIEALAVGDGDGDGLREIYAMSKNTLMQARSVQGVWQERVLLTLPEGFSSDMTFGELDGLPGTEMYVAAGTADCPPDIPMCFVDNHIYRIRHDGGAWEATAVAEIPATLESLWVGDGDRDGRQELYIGHGGRHSDVISQVQLVADAWENTRIGNARHVVVADIDRDGRTEVYGIHGNVLNQVTYDPATGTWTQQQVVHLDGAIQGASSLFVGDADNDGKQDLYVGTYSGEVHQVRYTTQWTSALIARPIDSGRQTFGDRAMLVVGDGDGDGRSEAYAGISFGADDPDPGVTRVYQVSQAPGTFDASFTSVRGNEWWVQANVVASGGTIANVDVRLNSGDWKALGKQTWGPNAWAASYHLPQGTIVQFRATSTTGATDLSDCYRWIPASNTDATKVACGSTPPPPPPGEFDATFTGVRGNEWWIQANVATNGPAISMVHVTLDDGATWRFLAKQSWGPTAWAESYHIVQGTVVQMRATAVDGQTDLSSCRQWIPQSGQDAKIVPCGSSPPPEPEGFQATFSKVAGNRYWQEVVVTANKPLTSVVFTTDCKDADEFGVSRNHLQYRSDWGKWVSNGAVMDGSKLTFFAYAENPSTQTGYDRAQSGPYLWPGATPTTC